MTSIDRVAILSHLRNQQTSEQTRSREYAAIPYPGIQAMTSIYADRAYTFQLLADAVDVGLLEQLDAAARCATHDVFRDDYDMCGQCENPAHLDARSPNAALLIAAGAKTDAAPAPTFAPGDVVNVVDGKGAVIVGRTPGRPYEGLRGVVVHVAEQRVAMAFDDRGSYLTLPPSQLMHHQDWIALDDSEGLAAAADSDVLQRAHDTAMAAMRAAVAPRPDDGGALNDNGRDYAEEAWQRDEAEREALAELAAQAAGPAGPLYSTPLAVAFSEPGAEVLARAHDTAMAAMNAAVAPRRDDAGGAWEDPAVRAAVRQTIAVAEAARTADCGCCDDSTGGAQ